MTPPARIERILDDLRACTNLGDVHKCYDHYKDEVEIMAKDSTLRPRAIHIFNLKKYRILCLRNGWG